MTNNRIIAFPELETKRIRLRLLTLADSEEVYHHFSDSEVTRYMDIEPCKDMKEAEEIIQYHLDDAGCRWGLYDKMNHTFLGFLLPVNFSIQVANQVEL